MGIPGLYDLIGKSERVSLCKLAVDHYEQHGRKLRVAIDASIWLFQVRAGRGGADPELRTLYYRLIRLVKLGIDPVLVFDGKDRPSEKRNKKITGSWESRKAVVARSMLNLFGFVYHQAPGEAEAECAALQKNGVVDAVFSEDGDTLMFGATMTIRNWSSQDKRGSKASTHVDILRAHLVKSQSGLDQEGMILIALMSGGDYDTVGIKGCGSVIARDAARAGFGHDLCNILLRNTGNLEEWRERLKHELRGNESKFFRRKSPKIASGIEDTFPSKSIAMSYLNPLVSSASQLTDIKAALSADRNINIYGLRAFVADRFEWGTLGGAIKFIRGLAPAILSAELLKEYQHNEELPGLLNVCGTRTHYTSDGIPESRVEIRPIDLVPIDLSTEYLSKPSAGQDKARVNVDINSEDDEQGHEIHEYDIEPPPSPTKRKAPTYDPTRSEKHYVPELYVRNGALAKLETWERIVCQPKPTSPRKQRTKKALAGTDLRQKGIESYFTVKKKLPAHASISDGEFPPEQQTMPKDLRQVTVPSTVTAIGETFAAVPPRKKTGALEDSISDPMSSYLNSEDVQFYKPPKRIPPITWKNDSIFSDDASNKLSLARSLSPLDVSTDGNELITEAHHLSIQQVESESESLQFTSPVSSQDLLQAEQSQAQDEPEKMDSNFSQTRIRLRESLPGSWEMQGSRNFPGRGILLGPVEVIDLT